MSSRGTGSGARLKYGWRQQSWARMRRVGSYVSSCHRERAEEDDTRVQGGFL
jgi:hypothetical protein